MNPCSSISGHIFDISGPFPIAKCQKIPVFFTDPLWPHVVAEEKAAKEAGMDPENYQVCIRIEGNLRFVYSKFCESGVEHQ